MSFDKESSEPPVRVEQVRRGYDQVEVLQDISFKVRPGERFCIIGSNGAGKSTLLSILAGLRRPDSGDVKLFGMDPSDPKLKARRGIQLERPYFPYYAKVKEVVWLFASMHPKASFDASLLQRYRLRGKAYVRHLSKGQRQRLAILLATLGEPDLLILDEPTSGLDPEVKSRLWREISEYLGEKRNRALLFTTHELGEAEQWAHQVGMLHRGRMVLIGTPDDLCRQVVGTERKLTLVAKMQGVPVERILSVIPSQMFSSIRVDGREATIYTNNPKKVLKHVAVEQTDEMRIGNVSLEDVFLSVTGSEKDARAVA